MNFLHRVHSRVKLYIAAIKMTHISDQRYKHDTEWHENGSAAMATMWPLVLRLKGEGMRGKSSRPIRSTCSFEGYHIKVDFGEERQESRIKQLLINWRIVMRDYMSGNVRHSSPNNRPDESVLLTKVII